MTLSDRLRQWANDMDNASESEGYLPLDSDRDDLLAAAEDSARLWWWFAPENSANRIAVHRNYLDEILAGGNVWPVERWLEEIDRERGAK